MTGQTDWDGASLYKSPFVPWRGAAFSGVARHCAPRSWRSTATISHAPAAPRAAQYNRSLKTLEAPEDRIQDRVQDCAITPGAPGMFLLLEEKAPKGGFEGE